MKLFKIKECRQTTRNPKKVMLSLFHIILFIFIFIPFYFHQRKSLLLITRNKIFSRIFICHHSLKSTTLNIWVLKNANGEVSQREEKARATTRRVHTMPFASESYNIHEIIVDGQICTNLVFIYIELNT